MGYKTYTCPHARRCGGCEWLAVPYELQLKRKQQAMSDLFAEVVEKDDAELVPIVGMGEPLAFRHKAASPYAPSTRATRGRMQCGFYERGTHRLVYCKECLVEAPEARQVLRDVARVADELGIRAYAEDQGRGVLRHAVVRVGYATSDMLLTMVTNGPSLPHAEQFVRRMRKLHPRITSVVQNVNDRRTNAILGTRNNVLFGPGIMHDKLLGCTFEIGPTSFYQTNPAQTEVLYALALAGVGIGARGAFEDAPFLSQEHEQKGSTPKRLAPAEERGGTTQRSASAKQAGAHEEHAQMPRTLLDAYCGTGTIGICAAVASRQADNDLQVIGVEQVSNAVGCARRNARANNISDQCSFVCADATEWMAKQRRSSIDAVVLDPPRAGSTAEFLDGVARLAPELIAYVSCNPQTQVRDLAILRKRGYRVTRITPVDMFPHTKHVETVVLLVRGDR